MAEALGRVAASLIVLIEVPPESMRCRTEIGTRSAVGPATNFDDGVGFRPLTTGLGYR